MSPPRSNGGSPKTVGSVKATGPDRSTSIHQRYTLLSSAHWSCSFPSRRSLRFHKPRAQPRLVAANHFASVLVGSFLAGSIGGEGPRIASGTVGLSGKSTCIGIPRNAGSGVEHLTLGASVSTRFAFGSGSEWQPEKSKASIVGTTHLETTEPPSPWKWNP